MLVLTRKLGERINIGDGVTLTVIEIKGQRVRLGIDAPLSVPILRSELVNDWRSGEPEEVASAGRSAVHA